MTFLEALRMAAGGPGANKMRSALTMLGTLIGVAAVVLLVAIGNGATAAVQGSIQGLGSNLLIIMPSTTQSAGVQQGLGTANTLTMADAAALDDPGLAPDIVDVLPMFRASVHAVYGNQNWSTSLQGVTQSFLSVRGYSMAEGQFFTDDDVQASSRVVCWARPS